MATAREDDNAEDDLTVCSICLERFNKPKYLPCLHTFCEACLSKYITSAYEPKESEQGFLCPTCRTFTEASSKDSSPEKWSENFPLNHLIVSLIDREKSREKGKLCDSCTRGEIQSKAEHWCQNCSDALCQECKKYHLTNKSSMGHSVISLEDVQKPSSVIANPDIQCSQHTDKKLEIYCYDHETPCCVICMTVHHRSCHKVNTIEEATKEIINSAELQSLQESFLEIRQELQDTVDDRKKAEKEMEKSKIEIEKKITDERKRIDTHLDTLENKLRQEVSTIHTEHTRIITEQRKILQDKTSIVENCIKVLKTCQTNKIRNVHILLELKQLKSKQKQLNEFYNSEVAKIKNIKLQLDITEDVSNLTSNIKSFGKTSMLNLDDDKQILSVTPTYNFHTAEPKLMKSFKKSEKGYISSSAFLPTGHVLLVHWNGDNKVTLIDLNGKCVSSLTLSGSPWDVTLVNPQEAVVTLPSQKQLVYINIDPSSLSLSVHKTVTLDGACCGICRVGQTLLVTYHTQLNVLDLEGRIMNTIKVRESSTLLYVTEHKDNIYLSDYDQHCVVCIDSVGTEIFRYTSDNLRYPWKITADCEDNIYVAGYYSHNIHQLTSDGKLIRILPVDVKSPMCLVFEENSNQFLVYSHNDTTCNMYSMK